VGWNIISYSTFWFNIPGYSALGQIAYIISNPLEFLSTFSRNILQNSISYLREWIAAYGYGDGIVAHVPPATYYIFVFIFTTVWFLSPSPINLDRKTRIVLIFTGIFGCLLTILAIYCSMNPIGSFSIVTVFGRYFIPFIPLILLGLVPRNKLSFQHLQKSLSALSVIGSAICLVIYMLGILLSFYTVCGSSLYNPGACYQPRYKNWEPNNHATPVVTEDITLGQPFIANCSPLSSIRVWNIPLSQEATGRTRITLIDYEDSAILVEKWIDNRSITGYGWLDVPFLPVDQAAGKQYVIEITSDTAGLGLAFGMSERREYIFGLTLNDDPLEHDLLFQYGCEPLTLKDFIGH
jgi:hypothetical protein